MSPTHVDLVSTTPSHSHYLYPRNAETSSLAAREWNDLSCYPFVGTAVRRTAASLLGVSIMYIFMTTCIER